MHTCANLARKRMTTSASGDGMQREQKPSQTNRNPLCYLFARCSNALTTFVYLAKHLYSRPNGYKLKKDMCPPQDKNCISWIFRPILVIYSAIEAEKWVEFRKIIKMGVLASVFEFLAPKHEKMEQFHWLKISTFCNLSCRRYFSLLTILPSIIWHSAPIQTIFYPFWVFLEVLQFFDRPCPIEDTMDWYFLGHIFRKKLLSLSI